jgi:AcrR family transcriptional regulator
MNRKVVTKINVTEASENIGLNAAIRVEPVQARSTARVNALLDAASATMHDHGYEQLTTAMVAERAGASIGTVYRYFPDRIAVLQAVASRNLERVRITLNAALAGKNPQSLTDAVDVVVDTLVEMFRTEKGFRSLRVGDVLDIRPVSGARGANAEIATIVKDWVHENLGLRLDSAARLACETAIDVVDALLARAFMHSDRGDQTVIEEARRMARCSIEGPAV